ncbi:MAG: low-specificity L-threonine aldolase [Chloroflexota bacterium]|nr:low-specificity L-threonine aldolase [Chloroflexota bacterium]
MMQLIDLRSDTVSIPTPAMREAMANAPVGDDVYGEDPTVNELQAEAAAMLGKEAGLFVPSGTMGNLASVLAHCARGDEFIVGKEAHIFRYEAGSAAMYGGLQPNTLPVQPDGTLDLDDIRAAIRGNNVHFPPTRLICLENTQGTIHGQPLPVDYVAQVGAIAREHNLRLHVDGARLFNAATALGVHARDLVADADSASVCLSKGLCAPVGSVIVGSKAFIEHAHRIRKSLGGGMRQAGILAAAGLIALREMTQRLHEDHATARQFAEDIATLPYIQVDLSRVRTNMVYFNLSADAPYSLDELSARLKTDYDILMRPYDQRERKFRVVTHYWITPEHIERTIAALRALLLPTAQRERLAAD